MSEQKITAVIPAYNEERRIADIIKKTSQKVDTVLVVDDGSSDRTSEVAVTSGARVVRHEKNQGYIAALRTGFKEAKDDILVTIDADGEHRPEDIPALVKPIIEGKADLVLGKRPKIPRPSERFINFLTRLRVDCEDTGTGLRALNRELARSMELKGLCTCGTFVLEAAQLKAVITEVPVEIIPADKKRKIVWDHFLQLIYVLKFIIFKH